MTTWLINVAQFRGYAAKVKSAAKMFLDKKKYS
jgi:hypothetical protein